MGSPAASEARGERRVLRKKQLASNMRLTLHSCGRGSGCFQHQMISDLGPRGVELSSVYAQFSAISEQLMLAWVATHNGTRQPHILRAGILTGDFDARTELHYQNWPQEFVRTDNKLFCFPYWLNKMALATLYSLIEWKRQRVLFTNYVGTFLQRKHVYV